MEEDNDTAPNNLNNKNKLALDIKKPINELVSNFRLYLILDF